MASRTTPPTRYRRWPAAMKRSASGRVSSTKGSRRSGTTGASVRSSPVEPWTTLSSRVLLDHPFARVVEDHVRLPTGHELHFVRDADDREGRTVLDVVAAICRDEQGRVLLV